MPSIELIPKENAHGLVAGSDFGSSVRIMARSPTHVLFNGLGCRVWNRKSGASFMDIRTIYAGRPTKALYEAHRDEIDNFMGAGVAVAVLEAWKTGKTVLIDGGGEALLRPHEELRKEAADAYAAVSINTTLPLEGRLPTCKQCGKPLEAKFQVHTMGRNILPNHPRTVEDCQRLSNFQVVAIRDYRVSEGPKVGYVESFDTWDGESVFDPHFCSDACAAIYGRRAASDLPPMEPHGFVPKVFRSHDRVDHAPKEPERVFKTADGREFTF